MKLLISLVFVFLMAGTCFAPDFIFGSVSDHRTSAPLGGAEVSMYVDMRGGPRSFHAMTNARGEYRIPMMYTMYEPLFRIQRFGYRSLYAVFRLNPIPQGAFFHFRLNKITPLARRMREV